MTVAMRPSASKQPEQSISDELADELKNYRGQWVAIKGSTVVTSAQSVGEVMDHVRLNHIAGTTLHHVPEDPKAVYIL